MVMPCPLNVALGLSALPRPADVAAELGGVGVQRSAGHSRRRRRHRWQRRVVPVALASVGEAGQCRGSQPALCTWSKASGAVACVCWDLCKMILSLLGLL